MSSFKWRKEECNKSFANAINRLCHEQKSEHLSQRKKTSIVPEFDESKGWGKNFLRKVRSKKSNTK